MRDLFARIDQDPDGTLAMIYNHARIAGWYGLPRQEYADEAAEKASLEGYNFGSKQRAEFAAKNWRVVAP